MLPPLKKVKMRSLTFPTLWQTVIFRNYGYVNASRIAKVLGCEESIVHREAQRLGVRDRGYAEAFEQRGFITLIRANWHLLPYSQLMTLLDFDEKKLDFVLEKEDFLGVKLGDFKPECEDVKYSPLSSDQIEMIARLAKRITELDRDDRVEPFDFFDDMPDVSDQAMLSHGKRIVHGYLSPCGDAFLTDCADTLPDGLLARYKSVGINGIWLHGILSTLSPYPFCPDLALGYEKRRENLNKIIDRCKKYGISVYLYMNEPRALPTCVDEKFERLIGWKEKRTLCLSHSEVKEYLYEAVRDLCESAPELGGIFTITMSENPTHCNFLPHTECPVCKTIPAEESVAEVNNIFMRAMRDSGCRGELIANLWGWSPYMEWSEDQIWRGIGLLDRDISVMCVSEYDLEIEKGGVKNKVIDYSISNPGPSEITKKIIAKAAECGHRVYAKIQASNSWECAATPYIPVFDLVYEHIQNLGSLGVDDLFLTWTQGGYPSPSVDLVSGKYHDLDEWYISLFGELSDEVHAAVSTLCAAFREYPFGVSALYLSPHTLGSANLWDLTPEEKSSTMVCYAYDDFESWIYPYSFEVYASQLEKLLCGWQKGVDMLSQIDQTPLLNEILRYARVIQCHFKSDLLQTRFARFKRDGDVCRMLGCINEEKENAKTLLGELMLDARVGYEASNHYFYTERDLVEKILRMESFENQILQEYGAS